MISVLSCLYQMSTTNNLKCFVGFSGSVQSGRGVRRESVRQSPHSETLRDTPQSRCRPQRGRWSTQASGGLQCNVTFERLTFDNDRLSLYPDPLLEDTQPVSNFLEENLTMEELKEAFRSDIIKLKPGIFISILPRLFDDLGNGYITVDKFRDILIEIDSEISEEELKAIISEVSSCCREWRDLSGHCRLTQTIPTR